MYSAFLLNEILFNTPTVFSNTAYCVKRRFKLFFIKFNIFDYIPFISGNMGLFLLKTTICFYLSFLLSATSNCLKNIFKLFDIGFRFLAVFQLFHQMWHFSRLKLHVNISLSSVQQYFCVHKITFELFSITLTSFSFNLVNSVNVAIFQLKTSIYLNLSFQYTAELPTLQNAFYAILH